jgi:hexosaminidase
MQLAPSFQISAVDPTKDLEPAIARAMAVSMWHGRPPMGPAATAPILAELRISVADADAKLVLNSTAEAYNLTIPGDATPIGASGIAWLNATTWVGAVRGLETFTQLISYDFASSQYIVESTTVRDEPLYSYRGLLVDTSRHFFLKHELLRVLDAMAYGKFNVFLWHMVDDQSFPWVSESRPLLGQLGSYPPAKTHTYSTADLTEVYEFARARGIIMQVELDTPMHCASWGHAYPDMLICGNTSGSGLTNPASPTTWAVEQDLFTELRKAMPDSPILHLGGDEVETGCWVDSKAVNDWAEEKGGLNVAGWGADSVQCEYHRMQAKMARDLGFIPFVWDDARMCELGNITTTGSFDQTAIVDVWSQDAAATPQTVAMGYRTVISSMCEYLNSSLTDWETNWLCDPRNVSVPADQLEFIIGAHASRWGEFTDAASFFANTFPGAYGTAEKLWSSAETTAPANIADAGARLRDFRCILVRRGLPVLPLVTGYCPEEFNSNYVIPGAVN